MKSPVPGEDRTFPVRPFPYAAVPHLPPRRVRTGRRLARWLAPFRSGSRLLLRGLEAIDVKPIRLFMSQADSSGAWAFRVDPSPAVYFHIQFDGGEALLAVQRSLALGLVHELLGLPEPLVDRPLSRMEGGLALALLAQVLRLEGIKARASLRPHTGQPLPDGWNLVRLGVARPQGGGWAELALDFDTLGPPPPPRRLELERLEPTIVLELGRTLLELTTWETAQHGDALVFDGVAAPRPTGPLALHVRVGGWVFPACWEDGGTMRKDGPLWQTDEVAPEGEDWGPARTWANAPETSSDATTESREGDVESTSQKGRAWMTETTKTTRSVLEGVIEKPLPEAIAPAIAGAPVEVVAELGRVQLRGDELLGLLTGAVIPVGVRRGNPISLRVGGRLWAEGELVMVEDELAVRLTALYR